MTPEETCGIPHHGVDILPPDKTFSVADFTAMAAALEQEISVRGNLPILVGGTGLYVQSFLYGVRFAEEKTPAGLREQLAAELAEKGGAAMYEELRRADPEAARDELMHTMACKAAIKGGWKTSDQELERVAQTVMSGQVKYCPHGRPVAIELTQKELEKQFKRI